MLRKSITELLVKNFKSTQSTPVNLNKKYIHNQNNLNNTIKINSNVIDVDVQYTDEEQFTVYIENYQKIKDKKQLIFEIETIQNTININLIYKSINISNGCINVTGRNNIINLSSYKNLGLNKLSSVKLKVNIPKKGFFVSNISIKSTSSDISIKGIKVENYLNIKTTSGNINLKNSSAKYMDIQSISGEIFVDSILAKKTILQSTCGDIVCENINSSVLKSSSISGNIDVYRGTGINVDLKSTSGDILLSTIKYEGINLDTISGDISLNNKSILEYRIRKLNTVTILGEEKIFANYNMV